MKRTKGWYWVKFKSDEEPIWEVALWNGKQHEVRINSESRVDKN